VQVSDLYAQHFQPVASRDDFLQMENPKRLGYSHEQRHAAAGRRFSADIIAEQDKVAAADLLIFQFPLWWYSVPAILKGWADRVLSHGFAFTNELVFERGMLRGRRAMISVTTGGSAEELQADRRYTGTMDEFLKPFSGGVLRFVGLEVLPPHIAYAVATMDAEGRTRQIDTYRTMLRSALAT
jgi:putative NADPH-quinone reductase